MTDKELIQKLIECIEGTANIIEGAASDINNIQSLKGACAGIASGLRKSVNQIREKYETNQ